MIIVCEYEEEFVYPRAVTFEECSRVIYVRDSNGNLIGAHQRWSEVYFADCCEKRTSGRSTK